MKWGLAYNYLSSVINNNGCNKHVTRDDCPRMHIIACLLCEEHILTLRFVAFKDYYNLSDNLLVFQPLLANFLGLFILLCRVHSLKPKIVVIHSEFP